MAKIATKKNRGQKGVNFDPFLPKTPSLDDFCQKVGVFEANDVSKNPKKAPETGFLVKNTCFYV